MKKSGMRLSALALALAMAGSAQAIPLSDLFGGASITAGDKLFDQWELLDYTAGDPARVFNAANIEVTALNDGGLNPGPGLEFTASNDELRVTGDGLYNFVDLMFGFRVSTLGNLKIKDNSLSIGSALLANITNDLGMYILETIGTAPGDDDLGTKSVEFSALPPDPLVLDLTDSADFAPQDEIFVTKNILVWAVDIEETAELNSFSQRFSQVPEPASLALMGLGLAGLGFARRRNQA